MGNSIAKKSISWKEKKKAMYFKYAKEYITANTDVWFKSEVATSLGMRSEKTLYNWFPVGSAEYEEITILLAKNRLASKRAIKQFMMATQSPAALVHLYKLLADDEERIRLYNNGQPLEKRLENELIKEDTENVSKVNFDKYSEVIRKMLKDANRYSPVLEMEITAMASAWTTLDAANKQISKLDTPLLNEITTQGEKVVLHPAFTLQQRALDSMSHHAKLLGIDYENAPTAAAEGPLASLTKKLINTVKPAQGHMSVAKDKVKTKTKK